MAEQDYNTVDIHILYETKETGRNKKVYTASFKVDTGIQQYLDYYQQAFLHDHPEALKMEVMAIEAYHNDRPKDVSIIYKAEGKHRWVKPQ